MTNEKEKDTIQDCKQGHLCFVYATLTVYSRRRHRAGEHENRNYVARKPPQQRVKLI